MKPRRAVCRGAAPRLYDGEGGEAGGGEGGGFEENVIVQQKILPEGGFFKSTSSPTSSFL